MNTKVVVNNFVKRQTRESGKSYSLTLTFEQIAKHAQSQFNKGIYKQGYRDGVVLIPVDSKFIQDFVCPFTKINESTKLQAEVIKRRPEEEPYIQLRALNGQPLETGSVDLILYRNDVLAETNENDTESEWELISFHAIPSGIDYMPMGPVTMMRNQCQLSGGTKAHYSSEEWAESVKFWQKYASLVIN